MIKRIIGKIIASAAGKNKKLGRAVEIRLDPAFRVEATEALFGDLKVLLGPRCLA